MRTLRSRLALAAALLVAGAAGAIYFQRQDDDVARASEIHLLGANVAGNSPTATTTPPASTSGLATADASSPGLYGGVRGASTCTVNPNERPAPWASAAGIDEGSITRFVSALTPALLRVDTRVTDYDFRKQRPRQAILQAGTAVLLDRAGYPRVHCASGDPLGRPRPVVKSPRYVGDGWPSLDSSRLVVVRPATTPPMMFLLVDVNSGAVFARLPGSPLTDIDRPAGDVPPSVVEPGGQLKISSIGWSPGSAVAVTFDSPATTLTSATADDNGAVAVSVAIPAGAQPGAHRVTSSADGATVQQTIYVVAPAV